MPSKSAIIFTKQTVIITWWNSIYIIISSHEIWLEFNMLYRQRRYWACIWPHHLQWWIQTLVVRIIYFNLVVIILFKIICLCISSIRMWIHCVVWIFEGRLKVIKDWGILLFINVKLGIVKKISIIQIVNISLLFLIILVIIIPLTLLNDILNGLIHRIRLSKSMSILHRHGLLLLLVVISSLINSKSFFISIKWISSFPLVNSF